MTQLDDIESYILNSKYRSDIFYYLCETEQATPSEIAEQIDEPTSHVSRALSELREKDAVELLVPEHRSMGRYYGLTEESRRRCSVIQNRVRDIDWRIETPADGPELETVQRAKDEFGERLRFVGVYDGSQVQIVHIDPAVLSAYSDDELEQGLRTFLLEHSLSDIDFPTGECLSEITHFSDFSVLRVSISGELEVAVSFEKDRNDSLRAFAEALASTFERER